MFTGIVEELGTVRDVQPGVEGGVRLIVTAGEILGEFAQGESVAVDGVCLTVVSADSAGFAADVIGTTLQRTTLGQLRPGSRVNLERSLALGDRLGGHLVQGHVDGVGRVTSVQERGEHVLIDIELPAVVAEVTVLHGSIAVNGVSLTVNALPARDAAQVALIPFTLEVTNLSQLSPGALVNLEGDMIGKFVVEYMKRRDSGGSSASRAPA